MSDAACAEEEENGRVIQATACLLLNTIARLERGDITIHPDVVGRSNQLVKEAKQAILSAHALLTDNITACKGCPT